MLRRSPISRKTPLRQSKPLARKAMRRTRRKPVPAVEREHMARVAAMPCLVCQMPSTVHHVTSDGHKRITRSNRRVVPLCPKHHQIQHGPRESVEALGHGGFRLTYGIDLLFAADQLWSESNG